MTRLLSVTLIACALMGCGENDEPGSSSRDAADYELHSWVTELHHEELAALESHDVSRGTLGFSGAPARIVERQPGDVLIAGWSDSTPRGLLGAVISVSSVGGDTVVETMPVPLPMAFERLHAKLAPRRVDFGHEPASNQPGTGPLSTVSKTVGNKRQFDTKLYDLDEDPKTKDDQLYVHSELEGQVSFTATVDLDWLESAGAVSHAKECLKKIAKDPAAILSDCVTLPDVKVGFDVALSGDALLDVDGAASNPYESPPIPLNDEPWQLPELWVGPVLLTPELDFVARLAGDSATYFHARTEVGFEVAVKASVGTKSGLSAPAPKFEKHFEKPVVEVSSTGRSKASFGPRLSLLAYDTFGFSAEVAAFGELEADGGKAPCWDFRVGVELTPAIRLTVPWKKFGLSKLAKHMGWTWDFAFGLLDPVTLFDAHPFAEASASERSCKLPPTSALPLGDGPSSETYLNPTFSPWTERWGDLATKHPFVEEPGQARIAIEKSHSSGWVLSGAHVGTVSLISDAGKRALTHQVLLSLFPDEAALALSGDAASALALPTGALEVFIAADRLTLMAIDYDGKLRWRRRLRTPSGLPGPELRELAPVAMAPLAGGDLALLYSRTTPAHAGSEILLLRVSSQGVMRYARRLAFPSGQLSLGASLVPVGQDVVVTGRSFEPSAEVAYLARFDAEGQLVWARRLGACASSRVRIEGATQRASGDLALIGTYDISPERTFVATVSPEGEPRAISAFWTGSILQDVAGAAIAELPTSGFVTLSRYTPWVGNRIELATHDALGQRASGVSISIAAKGGAELADVVPSGLRLTTDGGALVAAHVTRDREINDHGVWVAKIPARTFELPAGVSPAEPSSLPGQPCALELEPATLQVASEALEEVDAS